MQFRPLADTGILLPEICLGTMTFGEQNTQEEAFQQLDYALDQGLYFWDTAEMYPVPPKPETQGATERMIGNWIASRGGRDQLFLASKIAGPSQGGSHIRVRLSISFHHFIKFLTSTSYFLFVFFTYRLTKSIGEV